MPRHKKGIPLHGWLNIDKPSGLTSTQVIGRVRRLLNAQKLGHAGTLDPLATGILPIALGEATKTIPFAQGGDKAYRFTVTWGEERNTDDADGETVATSSARPAEADIRGLLPRFIGEIEQIPPRFSAIKVDGARAYALARNGEEVELKPRPVRVQDLRLVAARADSAEFEMDCGKGTYVRSIARDMGHLLGCLGYISRLRRTRVGCFYEKNSIPLDIFEKRVLSSPPDRCLMPVETVLDDIPALALTDIEISRVTQGQSLRFLSRCDHERLCVAGMEEWVGDVLTIGNGKPVALAYKDGPTLRPVRVFNLDT